MNCCCSLRFLSAFGSMQKTGVYRACFSTCMKDERQMGLGKRCHFPTLLGWAVDFWEQTEHERTISLISAFCYVCMCMCVRLRRVLKDAFSYVYPNSIILSITIQLCLSAIVDVLTTIASILCLTTTTLRTRFNTQSVGAEEGKLKINAYSKKGKTAGELKETALFRKELSTVLITWVNVIILRKEMKGNKKPFKIL